MNHLKGYSCEDLLCENPSVIFIHDDVMKWKCFFRIKKNPLVIGGFPSQRTGNAELWCFLCCWAEQTIEQITELQVN